MRKRFVPPILLLLLAALPALADGPPATQPAHHDPSKMGEKLLSLSPPVQVIAIIGSTLISEDFTCVMVGNLIGHHEISWEIGGIACFMGIYVGDLLFFLIGRLAGARALRLRFFSRSLGEERLRQFGEFFDERPWAAIAACRILPGLRVPLYVTVGAVTHRTKAFFLWTCIFAFVWTPILIALVAFLGERFTGPFEHLLGHSWWTVLLEIVIFSVIVHLAMQLSTRSGRQTLARRFLGPFGYKPPEDGTAAADDMERWMNRGKHASPDRSASPPA